MRKMASKFFYGNNWKTKIFLLIKMVFYSAILSIFIILLLLLIKVICYRREWNWNEETMFTNINITMSNEKTGRRFMVPLQRSTCFPTQANITYDENYPDVFDWRSKGAVSPVINQLQCNACWAISILGIMESMVAIDQLNRGVFHEVTTLSVQEMIDCSYRKGCIVGDPRSAVEDMMDRNMSIVSEEEYPLTLRQEACRLPQNIRPKGVMVKSFQVACYVTPEYIMSRVYHHGPVAVTVNAAQWIFYTDGIITRNCPNEVPSNHVAQIVGYDKSGQIAYYIVKNSWGADFGIGGYVKVAMRQNLCGIEEYVTSVDVRSYGLSNQFV
ncbi:cathepsin O-like [Plodia interpunctella]|uniref:cathepsin O-like n=1 Tax=Plodia interpunctella TaxID=58824 RepID=UPI002367CE6A|nr:cathepsin O-like [Plodia interpunctella]